MERAVFTFFFCVVTLTLCGAEFTAENVYDFLSRRLDNTKFDIKQIRRDIKELNDSTASIEKDGNTAAVTLLKTMFNDFKDEIDTKFANLEVKLIKRVDTLIDETSASVLNQTNDQSKTSNSQTKGKIDMKTHMHRIQASLSAEKQVVRNTINKFQVRVEDVEQKMFAFENASWKGDKGDVGLPGFNGDLGPPGPSGVQGEVGPPGPSGIQGDVGPQGSPGPTGPTGAKGSKGETGTSIKGQKGEKWLTGYTGSKGAKGQKGSPEKRNSVYFHFSLSSDQTLAHDTIIKFDKVFSNHGNGYSSTTGIFTAPHSGVYLFLFSVRVGTAANDLAVMRLYVGGVFRAFTLLESHHDSNDAMTGNAYVSYMTAGEKAWIQTGTITGKAYHDLHRGGTTFTGILVN